MYQNRITQPFPAMIEEHHLSKLKRYELTSAEVVAHMATYPEINESTENIIGRITPTMAIQETRYAKHVEKLYLLQGAQQGESLEFLVKGAQNAGDLIEELSKIKIDFNSQLDQFYAAYNIRTLSLRRNGFIVEVHDEEISTTNSDELSIIFRHSLFPR